MAPRQATADSVPNPGDAAILRRQDGSFVISVSDQVHSGNWLPISTDGPFSLVFRIYDTPLTTGGEVSDTMMPRVLREECR